MEQPNPNGSAPVTSQALLEAVELTRHFRLGGMFSKRVLHAVDDFSLTIHEREIVALVGESGSGKSTIARLLARIYAPTRARSPIAIARCTGCARAAPYSHTGARSRWSSRIRSAPS